MSFFLSQVSFFLSLLVAILVAIAVGLLADIFGNILLIRFLYRCPTFKEFVGSVKATAYSLIIATVLCWIVFAGSSTYFIVFSTVLLIMFIRLDYDDFENGYEKAHKDIVQEIDSKVNKDL